MRCSGTTAVSAQVADLREASDQGSQPLWKGLQYTGLIDAFGGAHLQSTQPTALRVFDTNGTGAQLAYAKIGLWLDAQPIGFRVDVGFGQTIEVLSVDTSTPVLRQFEQGFLSARLPVQRGITIDAGRYLTPAGNEAVDSRKSWLYSRSLLFGFAAPFTHTGLRASAALTDEWSVAAGVFQGWMSFWDNNGAKSLFVSGISNT